MEISELSAKSLGVDAVFSGNSDDDQPIAITRFPSSTSPDLLSIIGSMDDSSNLSTSAAASNSLLNSTGLVAGIGNLTDGDDNFALLLNLLRADQDSDILSTPSGVALDNEEATLLVGQVIPITTGESLGANNITPFRTTAREEVGITLEFKPQINEQDSVALSIRVEVSSIAGAQLPNSNDLITNKSEIQSTVLADDKEIIVLGGLIKEEIEESVNKVPILGDIPLLGRIFRSSAESIDKEI